MRDVMRRLSNLIRGHCVRTIRFVPRTDKLKGLWPTPTDPLLARADTSQIAGATVEALMELCDDYWNSFSEDFLEATAGMTVVRDSDVRTQALDELARRGPGVLPWARARLRHPDYFAREDTAWLVGELWSRHPQPLEADTIIAELSALATRPIGEETKEAQANDAALAALGKIGGPGIIPTLRWILTSPDWERDGLCWNAALLLSEVVGIAFGD